VPGWAGLFVASRERMECSGRDQAVTQAVQFLPPRFGAIKTLLAISTNYPVQHESRAALTALSPALAA
jgi:hypothetical protein